MPSNLQIRFRDDFCQPEERTAVKRSVDTLVARAMQVSAVEAAREKLLAAVNAPLLKLIKEDPAAVKALDELRNQQLNDFKSRRELSDFESNSVLHHVAGINDLAKLVGAATLGARETRVLAGRPPYDFAWSWFDQQGVAPFRQITDNSIGRVVIDARSTGPYVWAHAGFGLLLTTDTEVQAKCYASCRARWEIDLAPLVGSNGSFGYMEFTALEDGRLLATSAPNGFPYQSEVVFNHKTHAPARFSDRGGPADVAHPRELVFTMRPGREYTFNVGLVVFANSGEGIASGFIDGDVGYIAVVRS